MRSFSHRDVSMMIDVSLTAICLFFVYFSNFCQVYIFCLNTVSAANVWFSIRFLIMKQETD